MHFPCTIIVLIATIQSASKTLETFNTFLICCVVTTLSLTDKPAPHSHDMHKIYLLAMIVLLFSQCLLSYSYRHQHSLTMSFQTSKPATIKLSPMVENMAVSKTIEMMSMTKEMEGKGIKVYSLSVGEPDYQAPPEVIEATFMAAKNGITKYTAVNGEAALRKAIAKDLTERKGTPYTADQIVVSNGAKQSVIQTLLSVVSPGDGVIIPAPYWVSYVDMVKMCGGVPVVIKTLSKDNYQLTPDTLRKTLSSNPNVSALILCNPSNPTVISI